MKNSTSNENKSTNIPFRVNVADSFLVGSGLDFRNPSDFANTAHDIWRFEEDFLG